MPEHKSENRCWAAMTEAPSDSDKSRTEAPSNGDESRTEAPAANEPESVISVTAEAQTLETK